MQWFGHVLRKPSTDLCRLVVNPSRSANWICRQGGQLKIWLSTVESDAERMGLVTVYDLRNSNKQWFNICGELASDRRQWAAAIRDIREADSFNNRS
ncbi:unnamed protein product [Dibothriocephalus latus]|uniref:Uncharacterized protein n=1 Tax=Dibothriocephalus latus TaxID=60516 RepID=A0A3P7NX71_DIBLA|nr:unnamed protein product [Dibothriocephalus latus]